MKQPESARRVKRSWVPPLAGASRGTSITLRAGTWLLMLMTLLIVWQFSRATLVSAQDESSAEVLEETVDVGSEASAPRPERRERTMWDTMKDGGTCGVLIGISSVIGLGFLIEHLITIRKESLMPERVSAELEEMIHEGRLDEAEEYCRDPANESLIADVVLAGLQRFRGSEFGFAEYKAAVEEAGEEQTARLYRKTEVLGVVAAIAPMLGLQGTVIGMIESFNLIASSGGTARPDELAGGIGKALVTTMEGLFVAIPAMIAFSYFRNKIDSVVSETGKRVEQILTPLGRRR